LHDTNPEIKPLINTRETKPNKYDFNLSDFALIFFISEVSLFPFNIQRFLFGRKHNNGIVQAVLGTK